MKVLAVVALACAACAAPDSAPQIEKLRPPWGPMTGGTTVEVLGRNFDPAVNRVFIDGREAPVVRTIDDEHLRVVIPPNDRPGDAEVVVITAQDNVIANGVFRYSDAPTIESVSPSLVKLSELPATIVVRGTGFLDEDAGEPFVTVGGQPLSEVDVRNDTTLAFSAPAGIAFTRPLIEITNRRGSTSARGYRYSPSDRPGLILYASSGEGPFAWFYEPVAGELIEIPRSGANRPCLYSAMANPDGTHSASAYCLEFPYAYARVDLESQTIVDLVPTNLYYAMTRHEGANYGIDLGTRRFGTFDDDGTGFAPIGTALGGFQFGLASARGNLYVAARDAASTPSISTIDPATGERGPTVPLSIFTDVYDMAAFDGTLYAVTSDSRLVTIDPATGDVTPLVVFGQSFALAPFE